MDDGDFGDEDGGDGLGGEDSDGGGGGVRVCHICGGDSFKRTATGEPACVVCGTLSQETRVESQEAYGAPMLRMRGRVVVRRAPRASLSQSQPASQSMWTRGANGGGDGGDGGGGGGAGMTSGGGGDPSATPGGAPGGGGFTLAGFLRAVQWVLSCQADELVAACGAPTPEFRGVVGRLWQRYLLLWSRSGHPIVRLVNGTVTTSSSSVYWAMAGGGAAADGRGGGSGSARGGGGGGGSDVGMGTRVSGSSDDEHGGADARGLVPLSLTLTLALLLAAARWLSLPFTPGDVARWARNGTLTYLGAGAALPPALRAQTTPAATAFFWPPRLPTPSRVARLTALLCAAISLPLPPINAALVARRMVTVLRLPRGTLAPLSAILALHPMLSAGAAGSRAACTAAAAVAAGAAAAPRPGGGRRSSEADVGNRDSSVRVLAVVLVAARCVDGWEAWVVRSLPLAGGMPLARGGAADADAPLPWTDEELAVLPRRGLRRACELYRARVMSRPKQATEHRTAVSAEFAEQIDALWADGCVGDAIAGAGASVAAGGLLLFAGDAGGAAAAAAAGDGEGDSPLDNAAARGVLVYPRMTVVQPPDGELDARFAALIAHGSRECAWRAGGHARARGYCVTRSSAQMTCP